MFPRGLVRGFQLKPKKVIFTLAMLLLTLIWCYPFIISLMTALKSDVEILQKGPLALPEAPSIGAFLKVWSLLNFKTLLTNSIILAAGGTALAILISLPPAYALSRFHIPGREIIFIILLTGMMLPQQTVVIPLWDILRRLNLLDSLIGLIIVHGVYGLPFVLLILRGFMVGIPEELESAARVDGCSDFGVFQYVIVPLVMPAIAVAFTLNFINVWKEFFFALIMLYDQHNFPVTVGLLQLKQTQYFTSWNLPAAGTLIAQIPIILLYILAYRWITKGIYAGAVKG
jgi:raffinose/stachyose/melibiose transport system permease protein